MTIERQIKMTYAAQAVSVVLAVFSAVILWLYWDTVTTFSLVTHPFAIAVNTVLFFFQAHIRRKLRLAQRLYDDAARINAQTAKLIGGDRDPKSRQH